MNMEIKNSAREIVKAGCVVIDGNKVLLITNPNRDGYWAFPKGHAEEGETVEQVALRETFEETGYKVELIKRLQDVVYGHGETGELIRVAIFLAKPVEKVGEGEEISEWVDITKARELIWPNGLSLLDEIGDIS